MELCCFDCGLGFAKIEVTRECEYVVSWYLRVWESHPADEKIVKSSFLAIMLYENICREMLEEMSQKLSGIAKDSLFDFKISEENVVDTVRK